MGVWGELTQRGLRQSPAWPLGGLGSDTSSPAGSEADASNLVLVKVNFELSVRILYHFTFNFERFSENNSVLIKTKKTLKKHSLEGPTRTLCVGPLQTNNYNS